MELIEISAGTPSPRVDWDDLFLLRQRSKNALGDAFLASSSSAWQSLLLSEIKQQRMVLGIFHQDGKYVGFFFYRRSNGSSLRIVQVFGEFSWPHFTKTLATLLSADNSDRCLWRVIDDQLKTQVLEFGGRPSNGGCIMQLRLSQINQQMAEKFENRSADIEKDYRIESHVFPPERFLTEYCQLATQLLRDMPAEDESIVPTVSEEQVRSQIESLKVARFGSRVLFLWHQASHELIGVNWATIPPRSDQAYIGFTGIRSDHRARGLAGYLRLNMLRYFVSDHPEISILRSEVYASNYRIVQFNQSWGFETVACDKDFIIPLELLQANSR